MRYLIAMDSFKGCLDADKVCSAVADGILQVNGTSVVTLPLADGGEGTAAAVISALGGEILTVPVTDPFGDTVNGYIGVVPSEDLAVIDTASASGLGLAKAGRGNILTASTFGTGLQIVDALDRGFSRITVGLGGSGTNDGGTGLLAALGAKFYRKDGSLIERPCAGTLAEISLVDLAELDPRLSKCELVYMYDVEIPLHGEHGSTKNYSPQKGADAETVEILENAMISYADAAQKCLGVVANDVPGAGAAGGLGFGLFLAGAKGVNGALHMLDLCKFRELCDDADVVITGEGATDFQTAHGKLPAAVAATAKSAGLPVICLSGAVKPDPSLYTVGFDAMFAIPNGPITLDDSIKNAASLLRESGINIAGLISSVTL